ncbi:MAG: OadG family protein [Selenomonadaceae bacterium]|nr:OadG family protein [Selenomonadaceae bacterium]
MDQPVTTNPFVIMLINMTIVFIVLVSLSFLIRLIHYCDPTKVKEIPAEEPKAVAPPPPPPVVEQPVEEGIPEEVIAVICAAISTYGYSVGQIHSIRPVHNNHAWEHSVTYPNTRLTH